jgi:hypothetical protein
MICPRCGTINPEEAERCSRCQGSLEPPPPESERIFTPARPQPAAAAGSPEGADSSEHRPSGIPPASPGSSPGNAAPGSWPPPTPGSAVSPPSASAPPPGWPPPPDSDPPPPGSSPPPHDWDPPPPALSGPAPASWDPPPPGPPGWAPPPPPAGAYPAPQGWGPPTSPQPAWPPTSAPSTTRPFSPVPNYLIWSILCTVFFFTPAGAVGIVLSVMASRRAAAGDLEGATRASRIAKTSCWVSVILGLVLYLLLAVGAVRLPGST